MNQNTSMAGGKPERLSVGKLVFGIVLVAAGVLAFVDAIDLWDSREIWRYWPVVLIAVGVSNEIDTLRTRRGGGGGFVLVAVGVWMLASTQAFWGLTFKTAFPLAISVVGLGMILHALLGVKDEQEKEEKES